MLPACPSGEGPNVDEDAIMGGRSALGFCSQDFLSFFSAGRSSRRGNHPFSSQKTAEGLLLICHNIWAFHTWWP